MNMLWPCDYHVLLCKGRQGCTVIDSFFLFYSNVIFVLCGTSCVFLLCFILFHVSPELAFLRMLIYEHEALNRMEV